MRQHRLTFFRNLGPQEIGSQLINKLPQEIQILDDPRKLKKNLTKFISLFKHCFYSIDKFLDSHIYFVIKL